MMVRGSPRACSYRAGGWARSMLLGSTPGSPAGRRRWRSRLAAAAADLATALTGERHAVDPDAVFAHLCLPMVVGDAQTVPDPRPAPAGGWVHSDVLPEDEALYDLVAAEPPAPDAELLADRAQICRLAVTPYRAAPAPWAPLRLDVPASPRRVARPGRAGPRPDDDVGRPVVHPPPGRVGRPGHHRRADHPSRRPPRFLRPSSPRSRSTSGGCRGICANARTGPRSRRRSRQRTCWSSRSRGGCCRTSATTTRRCAGFAHACASSASGPSPIRRGSRSVAASMPPADSGWWLANPPRHIWRTPTRSAGSSRSRRSSGRSREGCANASRSAWRRSIAPLLAHRRPPARRDRSDRDRAARPTWAVAGARTLTDQARSSASATRSTGWRTVRPAAARCIAHPGLALATIVAPVRVVALPMASTLRARTRRRQGRLQRRVGAPGAAAQPVVVELDDVGDVTHHRPHRFVAPLDMTEVARILHDHRAEPAVGRRRRGAGRPGREPLLDVDDPGRERRRLRRPHEVRVVLERGAAAGRVHDDRVVARHRRDRPLGQPAGGIVESRVDVQRTAAAIRRDAEPWHRSPRSAPPSSGGCHASRRPSHIPCTATRCRPSGRPRRRRAAPAAAAAGRARPAAAPAAVAAPTPAVSTPPAAAGAVPARRTRPAATAASSDERRRAPRVCPPSGARTGHRWGRPARTPGTGCTSP